MLGLMDSKEHTSSLRQNVHSWFARQLNDQKPEGTIAPLDGIRALAFLLVFQLHFNHTGIWNYGTDPFVTAFFNVGRTGVTLFFVLSGFLLFLPYTKALLFAKEWPQPKIYYIRRVLRIFPGYFFSLFILVMLTQPYFIQPHNWKQLLPFLTFTMGYTNSNLLNGPYWTLAVEFQYYLILPLIAFGILALTRLVRPEKRLWVVVGSLFAMIIWGLLTEHYGPYFANHPDQTFLPRPLLKAIIFIAYGDHGKFLEDFAVGMLVAVGYLSVMHSPRKELYLRRARRLLPWLLILCIPLFVYVALPSPILPLVPNAFQVRFYNWINEFAFALCYGYLVTAVLFNRPGGWLMRIFSWTPLRWLGLISYSLYIWHRPLVQIFAANLSQPLRHLHPVLTVSLLWIIALSTIIVFCFFLFVLIEKPGMLLSEKLRQQILARTDIYNRETMVEPAILYSQIQASSPMSERVGAGRNKVVLTRLHDKNSL